METIKRIPRPLGTTELSKQYNITKDNDHYIQLERNIIFSYIRNNFSYCGTYMNTEQFAFIIKSKFETIQSYMIEYGKELSKGTKDLLGEGNDLFRAIFSKAFFWGMENRSLVQNQLTILLQSQGNQYMPFISGEVNKTLKLMMDSSGEMQSLIRLLGHQGSATSMPFSPSDNTAQQGLPQGPTVDDMVRLLKTENITPLKDNEQQQKALYAHYDIDNMPEVNALLQTNLDKSKEGLNIKSLTQLSDKQLEGLKANKHATRREEENDFDMDSDQI